MARRIPLLVSLLLLLAIGVATASHESSILQAGADAKELRTRAELERLESAFPQIPDRGAALFARATLYARLGDLLKSLSLLKECIALNEGFDPDGYAPFDGLRRFPEFHELIEQIHRLHPPVHRADIAFTIPEPDLFPEGIAYDPARHVFYLGSMYRRKIIRTTETGRPVDLVKPDLYDLGPVGGVHVDPGDQSLWAATDPVGTKPSELLHFSAQGKLLERYPAPGPGPHDLNDLVIRNSREVYVSDTEGHTAYRFDQKSHEFTALALPRPLFYPNGITVSEDTNLLYVADSMGVLVLDLRTNAVHEVDPGKNTTLAGIDGLYWYKNSLIGVQYGTGAFRVARFQLEPGGLRVGSIDILEYRSLLVSDPTTGATVDKKFYFIANTGIYNLHDGKISDSDKLEPVHIAAVPLE